MLPWTRSFSYLLAWHCVAIKVTNGMPFQDILEFFEEHNIKRHLQIACIASPSTSLIWNCEILHATMSLLIVVNWFNLSICLIHTCVSRTYVASWWRKISESAAYNSAGTGESWGWSIGLERRVNAPSPLLSWKILLMFDICLKYAFEQKPFVIRSFAVYQCKDRSHSCIYCTHMTMLCPTWKRWHR